MPSHLKGLKTGLFSSSNNVLRRCSWWFSSRPVARWRTLAHVAGALWLSAAAHQFHQWMMGRFLMDQWSLRTAIRWLRCLLCAAVILLLHDLKGYSRLCTTVCGLTACTACWRFTTKYELNLTHNSLTCRFASIEYFCKWINRLIVNYYIKRR